MKRLILGLQILGLVLASQAFAAGTRTTNTLYVSGSRVVEVDRYGTETWSYGNSGELNSPRDAERLANGNTLIADTNNNRVIEVGPAPGYGTSLVFYSANSYPVDAERKGTLTLIVFQNSNTVGIAGSGNQTSLIEEYVEILSSPLDAEWLPNGNILIANNSRIKEVQYTGGTPQVDITGFSNCIRDVEWLPNGHILIAEGTSSCGTVTEMTKEGTITWQHITTDPAYPAYDAERLSDGNTLVTLYNYDTPDLYDVTSSGTKTWLYELWSSYIVDAEEVLGTDTIYNTAYMYYQNAESKWMPYAAAFATNTMYMTTGVPMGTPNITLTKTVVPPGSVTSGATMTYTIVFENTGNGTATNCTLYDGIPAGCWLDGEATGSGTKGYSTDGGATWLPSPPADLKTVTTIKWYIGTIGPNPHPSYKGECKFRVKVKD